MARLATETRAPRRRRWAAAVVVAGTSLALAGCGGGGSKSPSGASTAGSSSSAGVAYAQCMRAHGVNDFPDNAVSSSGGGGVQYSVPGDVRNNPSYPSAQQACQSKLPGGGAGGGGASTAQVQSEVNFSNCMHAHGVANFPEPNAQGAMIVKGGASGVDPNSPTFKSAQAACQHFLQGGGKGGSGSGLAAGGK